ncbi:uncharacterized protein A1O5_04361 [Cladophialophora psammophila CBS 110553]|uniref:Carboxymuconolactone decarboxylase-like domain-containing protein n=1 Tax=Cladophialophora psammophila CBS 110553 TaxID=1182543 RepID=W9X3K8_9EURO|nr:uncharacterized protein A1O5_04361 [Cladophialophora psammophila CBS 110553]EXJ71860.1 hypothetical protein A1O5_04361 [Cladophialophora psammophila CBS 110553]
MKLNYTPESAEGLPAEDASIYERVRQRRGGRLLPLDRALLHSPQLTDGWNSLLGAVRTKGCLSDDLREICILRPALINRAWFEWNHHAPIFEAAPGVTAAHIDVLSQLHPAGQGALNDRQWAVLRYSDAMTKDVSVPDEVFDELRRLQFNEQEIVEITLTCAAYNMVSRFLVALDVGEANGSVPAVVASHE